MQFSSREISYIFFFFIIVSAVSYGYVIEVFPPTSSTSYKKVSTPTQKQYFGYNFEQADQQLELPKSLLEISGLTDLDDQTIACVQDESGIVFIYDLNAMQVIREFEFAKDGDYEGITRVNNDLYILRSDAKLFAVENYLSNAPQIKEYKLDIPVKDSEGLAFDALNNRLLIGGKSEPKGDEYEDKRAVFTFDLSTKKLVDRPAYIFSEAAIETFIIENSILDEDNKPEKAKIYPSGLAVHPINGKLFVLSSKGKLLYVFNPNNQIEALIKLDAKLFPQPEGITFLDNGDLWIANEGGKGKPTLLLFSYQP